MFLQMVIFLTMALLNVHMTEGAVAFGKAETHPGEFILLRAKRIGCSKFN